MSNEDILKKAIEKAQANGYRPLMTVNQVIAHNNQYQNPIAIIFTHDFAKAFWGEEKIEVFSHFEKVDEEEEDNVYKYPIAWQYHLQQMVLEEEPLQYLKKFLDKE